MARLNLWDTSFPARFSYLSSKQDLPTFDLLSDLIVGSNREELDGNIYVSRWFTASVINDSASNNGIYILLWWWDYTDINDWFQVWWSWINVLSNIDRFVITSWDVTNWYLDLSQSPNSNRHIDVIYNGATLDEWAWNDYTISWQRVTFSAGVLIANGTNKVIVKYYY